MISSRSFVSAMYIYDTVQLSTWYFPKINSSTGIQDSILMQVFWFEEIYNSISFHIIRTFIFWNPLFCFFSLFLYMYITLRQSGSLVNNMKTSSSSSTPFPMTGCYMKPQIPQHPSLDFPGLQILRGHPRHKITTVLILQFFVTSFNWSTINSVWSFR